jgi:hypothetical protein
MQQPDRHGLDIMAARSAQVAPNPDGKDFVAAHERF